MSSYHPDRTKIENHIQAMKHEKQVNAKTLQPWVSDNKKLVKISFYSILYVVMLFP